MSFPALPTVPIPQPPMPEPPPGTIISWAQQFTVDGAPYTYVAVHIAYRGWFVSNDSETPYSWAELFFWLIGPAQVFVATGWRPL